MARCIIRLHVMAFWALFPIRRLRPAFLSFLFLRLSFDPVVVHVLTYGRCAFDEKLCMFSKIPFDEGAMVLWVAGLIWAFGSMDMRWEAMAEVGNMNICISHSYIYIH